MRKGIVQDYKAPVFPEGSDEQFMQRCLYLAQQAKGEAAPNPMVGSVVVHKGKIIGEGYHHKCGEAHAEVNAINAVKDPQLLQEATLYVSLEPCAHQGRTPACSLLIIKHKIPRVVIACTDPFEKVAGKGIEMLRAAGVEVKLGVLEKEALHLNRRFFTFHTKKRPYIILKWAETIDGFIDIDRNEKEQKAAWITNELARSWVHKWRTEEASILVGTQTVLKDNPQLNVRSWTGKSPLRLSVDRFDVFPPELHLLDDSCPTLIFSKKTEENNRGKQQTQWINIGEKAIIPAILEHLYHNNILSVIVEGGKEVLDQFITEGMWDEARVFVGNKRFAKGTRAPKFDAVPLESITIDDCLLNYYKNNTYILSFQ